MTVQAAPRVQQTREEGRTVIVIDPGHGGENEGTIENGFLEKSMTMVTAQAMYDELCRYDNVDVYLTRTGDVDLTLKERAEFAASVDADFLFSIHYNASVEHDLFGSEIWISAFAPFNSYGYQFGYVQMENMRDMGLFLRGIKTRLNDRGTDYYGIIREATALNIPSAIIEHCHVDEERDYPYCDTDEELIAFGKADALSVAKYFGLSSTALGVDYSASAVELPEADKNLPVQSTLKDETPPDICQLTLVESDYNTGVMTLELVAADYDSPLIYYQYSYDGGLSYSPLQPWPGSDVLHNTYTDTFTFSIQIPSGVQPTVSVLAYNMFDAFTESNRIMETRAYFYGEDAEEDILEEGLNALEDAAEEKNLPGTTTFMPEDRNQDGNRGNGISFIGFLQLCLIIVILLFGIVLVSQAITYRRRRRRRHRRNVEGDKKNHNR